MPIYEYKCAKCGNQFEELVFSQDEIPPCPQCGSEDVTKLMSACAVQTDSAGPDLGAMAPSGGGCGGPGGG